MATETHTEEFLDLDDYIEKEVMENGGFTNAHAHPSRAFTLTRANLHCATAPFKTRWDANDQLKRDSTVDQVYDRMASFTQLMIKQGVTAMAAWVDVDASSRDKELLAAQKLKEAFPRGSGIDIVVINQTLKGVLDPEAYSWFRVGAGSEVVDIVGGLPGRDKGREQAHVEKVIGTAKELGKMAHVHTDQFNTLKENETEILADETIRQGMEGKVVSVHAISLGAHYREDRERMYQTMTKAGLRVVSCPNAWKDIGWSDEVGPIHPPYTPIKELLEHNSQPALGTDNAGDIYLPGLKANMMDEVRFVRDAFRLYDRLDDVIKMASVYGRRSLGLPDFNISRQNGHVSSIA